MSSACGAWDDRRMPTVFSHMAVMRTELLWIWLPSTAAGLLLWGVRARAGAGRGA